MISPVKSEDVVSKMSPVKIGDDRGIENFLKAKHPRILRHREGQVVLVPESKELTIKFEFYV